MKEDLIYDGQLSNEEYTSLMAKAFPEGTKLSCRDDGFTYLPQEEHESEQDYALRMYNYLYESGQVKHPELISSETRAVKFNLSALPDEITEKWCVLHTKTNTLLYGLGAKELIFSTKEGAEEFGKQICRVGTYRVIRKYI